MLKYLFLLFFLGTVVPSLGQSTTTPSPGLRRNINVRTLLEPAGWWNRAPVDFHGRIRRQLPAASPARAPPTGRLAQAQQPEEDLSNPADFWSRAEGKEYKTTKEKSARYLP